MDFKVLYNQFYQEVKQAHKIVIIPHKNPDGDSIGASLGLYNLLTQLNKEVDVVMPNRFPAGFDWLPNAKVCIDFEKETERATKILKGCDLLIFVDFNSIKRLEKLADLIDSLTIHKMMVDHHPYPDDIAQLQISNTAVSSTCELTFDIIRNTPLLDHCNTQVAECFYTGIMTDTAALNHNSSRKETYDIVGELISFKVDKEKIHRNIFHSNSLNRFKLIGYIFSEKLIVLPNVNVAIIPLTKADLEKFDYVDGDTEGFANLPLSIKDIDMSVFIVERSDRVKLSFRSRGKVVVNKFANQYFNGGGHQHAAGAESTMSFDKVLDLLLTEIPIYYESEL
ncbi:MAG: bifunctional oligoribonuclease/PAP phosphatase NrnA [Breznakibacter sp.]|nr:bifunctional oligoribonuclease/PAP phosphatase NrnA [Breznakibacter sp.]